MGEQFQLEAAVVDKFSPTLRKLRTDLQNVKPPRALEDVTRNFDRFRHSIEMTTKGLTGGFNQAISGLGISSLASMASIGGVAAAVKKLASGAIELRQFERETGMAADTLRRFKAIAGQFGADKDAFAPAINAFHEKLYDFKKRGDPGAFSEMLNAGLGDVVGRLRTEGITEALNDVLNEAAKNAEQGPEGAERAKRILNAAGLGSFTRLVLRGRQALADALRSVKLNILPDDAEEKAVAFENAFSRIEKSLEKLGQTAAIQFVEPLTKALDLTTKIMEKMPQVADKVSPGGMLENTKRELGGIENFGHAIRRLLGVNLEPYGKLGSAPGPANPALKDLQEKLQEKVRKGVSEGMEDFRRMNYSGGGFGGGARVWNASLGGGGGFGGGGSSGGSGSGLSGGGADPGGSGGPRSETPAGRVMRGLNERLEKKGGAVGGPRRGPPELPPLSGDPFLDLIGRAEGTDKGRGYNETLGYGLLTGKQNLTGMTLDQIDALQTQMLRSPKNKWNSSALGRYQIVRTTLRRIRKQLGLHGDEKFDSSLQDRLARRLYQARGNNPAGLRNEWEGLRRVPESRIADAYRRATEMAKKGGVGRDKMEELARKHLQGEGPAFDAARKIWKRGFNEWDQRGLPGFNTDGEDFSHQGDSPGREYAPWFKQRRDHFRSGELMARLEGPGSRDPQRLDVHFHNAPKGMRTKSEGELIRDVKVNRGRGMVPASQDA
jgi:muramidase (phage lysozyme)